MRNTAASRRKFFRSLEAKSLRKRSAITKMADKLTTISGSPLFLVFNALFFVVWIVVNMGLIPGVTPFDPFPFGLLTMAVSLEAIFLSIFVLVSQNRSSYTSTLRDEVELSINVTAEQEITKILELLAEMRKKMGITKKDDELDLMLQEINGNELEQNIAEQIERADKPPGEQVINFIEQVVKKPVEAILPEAAKTDTTKDKS